MPDVAAASALAAAAALSRHRLRGPAGGPRVVGAWACVPAPTGGFSGSSIRRPHAIPRVDTQFPSAVGEFEFRLATRAGLSPCHSHARPVVRCGSAAPRPNAKGTRFKVALSS